LNAFIDVHEIEANGANEVRSRRWMRRKPLYSNNDNTRKAQIT